MFTNLRSHHLCVGRSSPRHRRSCPQRYCRPACRVTAPHTISDEETAPSALKSPHRTLNASVVFGAVTELPAASFNAFAPLVASAAVTLECQRDRADGPCQGVRTKPAEAAHRHAAQAVRAPAGNHLGEDHPDARDFPWQRGSAPQTPSCSSLIRKAR